jgi:gliding motility-associated-like protein
VVDIVVHPRPLVDAGPDQVVIYSNPFSINPSYSSWVNQYAWSPPTNLSCPDCPSPSGIALTTTDYLISVKDVNGCRASDHIKIIVKCEQSNLVLPSAFTPNRDGTNDYFYPITRGYRSIKKMVIFSRNGFKVFERTNFQGNQPQMGWDGRIKGDARTDTQVFTWFVEGECETGETVLSKGTLILIK